MADWDFACPDWFDRLQARESLIPDLPLNKREAQRAVDIYNKLRLPDVPGQPPLSEASGEWSRDIVRSVFGSLDGDGRRRVREVFALVPKKNNKTTSGAAIMVTALLMNVRPRAEFVLVGPTQEVAEVAYQQATGMIAADPDGFLQKRFHVKDHIKTIVCRRTGARLKVKTFDKKVVVGSKPAGVLIDEIHEMSSMSYATQVLGQIRGGILPNKEAFLIFITTQSDTPPGGVFKSELEYARGIRDGKIIGGRMLPVLYEFPIPMQADKTKPWANPAVWPMVLPNAGLSFEIETLIKDYSDAVAKGLEEEQRWASQHLNIQIGTALSAEDWVGAEYWQDATRPGLTLDEIIEQSDVVTVGIDGGGLDDLFAMAVCGRHRSTREWHAWVKAWAQSDVFVRRKEIADRLRGFIREGDLVECAHPTQDVQEIADVVERLLKAGKLAEKQAIGLDPVGVAAMVDELASRGITDDMVCAVSQGYRLSSAIWGCERKLKDGTLWHCDQPLMAWCVGNAKAEQRGNAVLITKQVAGKAKIDPLMALFNAAELMSRNPEPKRPPSYQMMVFA